MDVVHKDLKDTGVDGMRRENRVEGNVPCRHGGLLATCSSECGQWRIQGLERGISCACAQ